MSSLFSNLQNQLSRTLAEGQVAAERFLSQTASNALTRATDAEVESLRKYYEELKKIHGGSRGSTPVSSNIESQKSAINSIFGNYARPSRFTIMFDGVQWQTNERLARNCQNVSLPGRAFQSQPHKIYGPPREHIYEGNYPNEIQLTFRLGEDMFEREFFDLWMNMSMSYSSFDLSYPDEYMTGLKVYQLDRQDNYLYCIQLYNVFCKSIADIELSSDASDQVETVTVTLGYSEHQVIGYRFRNFLSEKRAEMAKQDIKSFLESSRTKPMETPDPLSARLDALFESQVNPRSTSAPLRAGTVKLPSIAAVPVSSSNPGVADPIENNIYNTSSSLYGLSSPGGVPTSVEGGDIDNDEIDDGIDFRTGESLGGVPTSVEGGDINSDEIDDGIGSKEAPTLIGSAIPSSIPVPTTRLPNRT